VNGWIGPGWWEVAGKTWATRLPGVLARGDVASSGVGRMRDEQGARAPRRITEAPTMPTLTVSFILNMPML